MQNTFIHFRNRATSCGPLSPYIKLYLDQVETEGFARRSLFEQLCVLTKLGSWLKRTSRPVTDMDERLAAEFIRKAIKRPYPKNAATA